jgi:hypothetical protein
MCEVIQLPKTRKFIAKIQTTNVYEIEIDENLDPEIIENYERYFAELGEDKIFNLAEKIAYMAPNYAGGMFDGIGTITYDGKKHSIDVKGIRLNSIDLDGIEVEIDEKEIEEE